VQDVLLRRVNCSNLAWQELNEKFATAQSFGKLANVFADLPSKRIRDTGIFKAITGEDYISAQHKFKEYFAFKPFVRMLFSCESIPKNYSDRSGGFYRRLILIRFDNVIKPEKKDRSLKDKLALEADGILAWSIAGLKRLIVNDFCFTETARTKADLQSYRTENSSALSFVEECCIVEPKAEVHRTELYNAYLEYCKDNGIKTALTKTQFNKDLDEVGSFSRSMVSGIRTWKGIRLA
jgi:putative DNA primase/helicase